MDTSDFLQARKLSNSGEEKGTEGTQFIKHVNCIYFGCFAPVTLHIFSYRSSVKKSCLFVSEVL